MDKPLRVIFMGTPDFSVPALKSIIAGGHEVIAVYSQPPRPKGRGQQVQESPVHLAAIEEGIEVRTPVNFKRDEDVAEFMALEADVAIVAAYGLILPQIILDAPKHGCINIHASLLPRWRGAAPIQRSILEGDAETGITIMQMEAGLDTGPMISIKSVPIRATTTAGSLHDILSALGGSMIREALADLAVNGKLDATPQPDTGMSYAKMLKKEEGRIDWTKSADQIDRQIRALNPWPGTWCETKDGKRLKVLEAIVADIKSDASAGTVIDDTGMVSCGGGTVLHLQKIQPESKSAMDVPSAMRGGYLQAGLILHL